jgi:hypothetical protein
MNIEICKQCKYKKMIFVKNFDSNTEEFICIDVEYIDTYKFKFMSIICYYLNYNKWTRLIYSIFHPIWFKTNKTKYINKLFENINFLKVKFFGAYECPYLLEHKIYEWNKK